MPELGFLIVGTSRSGTTLVQRLVLELPGTAIPNETHFFSRTMKEICRRKLTFPLSYAEMDVVLAEVENCPRVDVRLLDGSSPATMFESLVVNLAGDGALHGEKTPSHLRWLGPVMAAWPDMRVIGVVRHPCAVLASHRHVPWGTTDPITMAARWTHEQRWLRRMLNREPERVLALRYEDVVQDPDSARTRIAQHLGVTGAGQQAVDESMLYMRSEEWKKRAGERIETDSIDRWKDEVDAASLRIVESLCWREMHRWGYGGRLPDCRSGLSGATSAPRYLKQLRRLSRDQQLINQVKLR